MVSSYSNTKTRLIRICDWYIFLFFTIAGEGINSSPDENLSTENLLL